MNQLVIFILDNFMPRTSLLQQLAVLTITMAILTAITCGLLRTPLKIVIGK